MVAARHLQSVWSFGIRLAITAPAPIVEHEKITFARQASRNQVSMMLADDPAEMFCFLRIVIRAELPDNVA
ncbi:hypothetical protein D3C77_654730 [compost metagenome]